MNTEAVSKATTQAVTAEIQKALEPILKKHNLNLTKLTSKYGDLYGLTITAAAVDLNDDGINMSDPDVISYLRNGYYGQIIKANNDLDFVQLTAKIGTRVKLNSKAYVFAGVRARGKNRIIMNSLTDGKTYVFADSVIPTLNEASQAALVK